MRAMWTRTGLAIVLGVLVTASGVALAGDADDERARARAEKDYDQAVRYTRAGRAKSAIKSYEKALPYRNESSDIFFNLVQVCEAAKQWDKLALYGQGFLYLEPGTSDAKEIERAVKGAFRRLTARERAPETVVFDIEPEGTTVYVDHVPLSANRVTEVKLLPGTYIVTATRQDYEPFQTTLTVVKGQPQTVKGALVKRVYKGKLAITTTPAENVKVFVNDEFVGTTPLDKPLELATLKYLVRFESPGYDSWVRYVNIEKDATAELKPVLERSPRKKAPSAAP